MTGWDTADATRNEVPDQKASIAVPLSFCVIIGSAMLRDVASRATASVIMHIEKKASKKPLVSLNSFSISFRGSELSFFGSDGDVLSLIGASRADIWDNERKISLVPSKTWGRMIKRWNEKSVYY
jgi:hypothetical protein